MGLLRKSGGGKLSDKDATITSLELTTKPFGDKTSDKFGEALYAVLHITPDGSEDAVFEPLKIGKADDYELDEDRPYWLRTSNADVIHPSSQFGKLLVSMIEVNVSPDTFVEGDDAQEADFSALVGARFHFIQKDDPEMQEKFGKKKFTRKDGTKGETDRRYLAVSAVYELGEKADGGTAKVGNASGKAASTKAASPDVVTAETIAAILRESPGRKLQRSKIAAKLALKIGKGPLAKTAQDLVGDEGWLSQRHKGFVYNEATQELKAA